MTYSTWYTPLGSYSNCTLHQGPRGTSYTGDTIDILVNTDEQYILSTKPTELPFPSAKKSNSLPSNDRIDIVPNEKYRL